MPLGSVIISKITMHNDSLSSPDISRWLKFPGLVENQFVLLLFIRNCPTTTLSFKLGERKAISKLSESLPELPYHRFLLPPPLNNCVKQKTLGSQHEFICALKQKTNYVYIHIPAFQLLQDWNSFLFSLIAAEFRACYFHASLWHAYEQYICITS